MRLCILGKQLSSAASMCALGMLACASESSPVSELYAQPPILCVAKPLADLGEPLVPLIPNGSSDPEELEHMTRLGSLFLERGREFLDVTHVDTVYTAIFERRNAGFEVGVYGFRFSQPLNASTFHISERPMVSAHFVEDQYLVIVWHDNPDEEDECFDAINQFFSAYSKERKTTPNI